MTDYLNIRGDAVSREKTTVGRFYQAVYQSGNVYAVRRTISRSVTPHFIVEKILHTQCGFSTHQVGDTVSCFSAELYKFKQVPDTVRYRGKQVTEPEQLTVGRWYILIDRDGTEYSGQYATKQAGPCILFTLDDESLSRRRHSGRFAVNLDGTSLRKVYKFTEVHERKPKPEQPVVADVVSPTGFPHGTRAVDIGAKEGDRFMFVDMPQDPRKDIAVGTIFTLSCDDGSRCPWFKDESGQEKCLHWERLAPYVPPVPATEPNEGADDHPPMHCYPLGTTSRRIGAKVGDQFIFVDDGTHHLSWVKVGYAPRPAIGQLVTLVEDDGSDCPYFTWDGAKGNEPIFYSRLAPYVPAPATEPEPAPAQEAANDDWADALTHLPEPVVGKAKEAVDLQRAARAIGLLANEVQKRYEVAQEAVKAHTVAVQALENAQRDLIELAKKATANETI